MLSNVKCSGKNKTLRQIDQRLLAPFVVPIRPSNEFDPVGGLLGNIFIGISVCVIVYALMRALQTFLGCSRNDAAAKVGWPSTWWTVLSFLHQGNCNLVVQCLVDPAFASHEKAVAVCLGLVLCVGLPFYFLWWHAEHEMSIVFRVYPPSRTFYFGAWGPNTRHDSHGTFFADSSPRLPLWFCVFPMFFVLALAAVEVMPLSCVAQASTLAALFGGFALLHALLCPRRWWVFNLQGFFANALLCAYCLVHVWELPPEVPEKILLTASGVSAIFSVVLGIAMLSEIFWYRRTIWPTEEAVMGPSFSNMHERFLQDAQLTPEEMATEMVVMRSEPPRAVAAVRQGDEVVTRWTTGRGPYQV